MSIALTAQPSQNFYFQSSNFNKVTVADDIRSLFGLASVALMAAGEAFKQAKDNLSRARFGDWLRNNGFVPADASKLINLFDYFGDAFNNLDTVSPLSLIRLVAPSSEDARYALEEMLEEYNQIGDVVTGARNRDYSQSAFSTSTKTRGN
jgi:hypothetical protein